MHKILLIDVSNLFFRAFYAFPDHFTNKDGKQCNAVYGVASIVFNLMLSERPSHIFAARDLRGPTWRHKKLTEYKAGRPPMPEELSAQLPAVFAFFEEALDVPLLGFDNYEADDVLATLANKWQQESEEILVLSADQDLLQLIEDNIFVLQPQHGKKGNLKLNSDGVINKLGVSPKQVPDYKGLAGDSSDRLVGVPGIGPKGASELLREYQTLENILANAAQIKGEKGELLQQYHQQAIDTKHLATLHYELPLEVELKQGECQTLPSNLMPFLDHISSRRLQRQAEQIWRSAPAEEQLALF